MQIESVRGNTCCLVGRQLIPLYMTDGSHCIMLDTGAPELREEIQGTLEKADLTPVGLLCTHTHYDHLGNAKAFSRRYGCPIALPLGEAELCRTPEAVKSHLYVFSLGQVKKDPQMSAVPCTADQVIRPEEEDIFFCGVRFRVLHTPGHSPDHVSYITPDHVCYGADALMCGRNLTAAKLPYTFDFHQSLDSMERLRDLNCPVMILAHRGIMEGPFDALAEENRRVMLEQLEDVRQLVDCAMPAEEICRRVSRKMDIKLPTAEKAQHLERFLRPYMECLLDDGRVRLTVVDNTLCYEPV